MRTLPTPRAVARHLFTSYEKYRLNRLGHANCKHRRIEQELSRLVAASGALLRMETVGRSVEGRSINLISCGSGGKTILLWSQMHGDESTATLALMDIFHFVVRQSVREPWVKRLLQKTTLRVIPMLNPDGAQRVQRQTAVHIDMNRDALALATPEARILRMIHRRCAPAYGFNLHDQPVSSVGASSNVAAIALLAPAVDEKNSVPLVRKRAIRVAAVIAHSLRPLIGGHIARYDNTFEPRAFGDNMQHWGTSTVLIESGHWPNDPEKHFVRRVSVAAIVSALWAVATGSLHDATPADYTDLPLNGKSVYDILIRNVVLEHPDGWRHPVDIGLMMAHGRRTGSRRDAITIQQIGDLHTSTGLEVIPGRKGRLASNEISVDKTLSLEKLLALLRLRHV